MMSTTGLNAEELSRIYNRYGVQTFPINAKPEGFIALDAEESTGVVIAVPAQHREALKETLRLINA